MDWQKSAIFLKHYSMYSFKLHFIPLLHFPAHARFCQLSLRYKFKRKE